MLSERPSPSILQVVVIAGITTLVIVFAIIAMNTGDILWFWPVFDGTPQRIVIHCYGEDLIIEPDDPAFDPLVLAVNKSLTGTKRWDSLSMSDATYTAYQTGSDMMIIELGYNPPERLHSLYKFFKNFDILIIPLDGRHAAFNTVFGRLRGQTLAGSFHVEDTTNIMTTLHEQALCHIP